MFVCISEYTDHDGVAATRPKHLEWLSAHVEAARIVCAGRRVDGQGGVLVVAGADEAAARELVAGDPYVVAGVAEYAWTAFTARLVAPAIAELAEEA